MAKTILVAVALLSGGVLVKDKLEAFEVEPGDELTEAKMKKLGLSADDVEELMAKGSVEEVKVREAESSAPVDDKALAAANKRADDAEAKLVTLQGEVDQLKVDLETATKPAAQTA